MDISYYKSLEPLFGSWHITKLIGEGSFGKVFEIERVDDRFGKSYKAALKVISIPQSESEITSLRSEGMSADDVTEYFKGIVNEVINEYDLMSKLKGNSYIVSCEDYIVVDHANGMGWDILIRMELLQPLVKKLENYEMPEQEVIKLAIDLCRALESCQKFNIIHRDIKPENIFISEMGEYKLGDFGIARMQEKTSTAMSRKGTCTYMAPEIYNGKSYGKSVDIYSIGLVMYRLLNKNRAPFFPEFPKPISYGDKENALMRRMNGEPIPTPANGSEALKAIVMKASSFAPEDRYASPAELRRELENLEKGVNVSFAEETTEVLEEEKTESIIANAKEEKTNVHIEEEKTESLFYDNENISNTVNLTIAKDKIVDIDKTLSVFENAINEDAPAKKEVKEKELKKNEKKKSKLGIVLVILALMIVGVGAFVVFSKKSSKDKGANECKITDEKLMELIESPTIGGKSIMKIDRLDAYAMDILEGGEDNADEEYVTNVSKQIDNAYVNYSITQDGYKDVFVTDSSSNVYKHTIWLELTEDGKIAYLTLFANVDDNNNNVTGFDAFLKDHDLNGVDAIIEYLGFDADKVKKETNVEWDGTIENILVYELKNGYVSIAYQDYSESKDRTGTYGIFYDNGDEIYEIMIMGTIDTAPEEVLAPGSYICMNMLKITNEEEKELIRHDYLNGKSGAEKVKKSNYFYNEDKLIEYASNPILLEYLKNPDNTQLANEAKQYTINYFNSLEGWEGIYLADWNSKVLTHPSEAVVGRVMREGEALKSLHSGMLSSDGVYNFGYIASPASGELIESMYVPIYDEAGNPVGYVGGGKYLKAFVSDEACADILNMKMEDIGDGYFYIVDSNCIMVYHPDESKIGNPVENDVIKKVLARINSGEQGTDAYGESHEETYTYKSEKKYMKYNVMENGCVVVYTRNK